MAPGTARNAASANSFSPQPANLDGPLSHQWAPPAPPEMASIEFSRNDSSTAFFSHWLTRHSPAAFSARRASPRSRAAIAESTASRTSPLVSGPMPSRCSHAASMTLSWFMSFPQYRLEPFADVVDDEIDMAFFGQMCAALRSVVDPDRGHAERLRGFQVLRHVLDQHGGRGVDAEALA